MKRLSRLAGLVFIGLLLAVSSAALAEVKLPAVIGSNMVLQREAKVPIWGTADPAEQVTVTLGDQHARATADDQGQWRVVLSPLKAGGPLEMIVAGKNTIKLTNLLVGEVWVCSGQSNMGVPLRGAANAEEEIAAAEYPRIRLFTLNKGVTQKPRLDAHGEWVACSPKTAARFSAVGYFFGREIHKVLDVPIGLIDNSWGGTPAEAWTSRATLESRAELKPIIERYDQAMAVYPEALKQYEQAKVKWREASAQAKAESKPAPPGPPAAPFGPDHHQSPAGLYNGMVMPVVPYAIRGVIWYQGEGNAGRAYQYRTLFPAMIEDWRRAWGQGDFPFLFVQLANFQKRLAEPADSAWAELREAQLMSLKVPNTAMAVIIDTGEADNIHPKNKQDVGRRLALAAQATVYHQNVAYSGPVYDSMAVEDNKIRLRFQHVDGGLVAKGGDQLVGFAIAGEDRKFVWARASIEGDTIVVSSDQVAKPVAVRYAWADNPACNLFNQADLPASPFRTDQWPGVTAEAR